MKPLLALLMVIDNEVGLLRETLDSVKDFIDHWTILDLGSIDGSVSQIQESLVGIPGLVYLSDRLDYVTAHNRAIELHGGVAQFTLTLDAGDALLDPQKIRSFLAFNQNSHAEVYNLLRQENDRWVSLPLILRPDSEWRYERGQITQDRVKAKRLTPPHEEAPGGVLRSARTKVLSHTWKLARR